MASRIIHVRRDDGCRADDLGGSGRRSRPDPSRIRKDLPTETLSAFMTAPLELLGPLACGIQAGA
ncbi:hypothetical protein ACCS78_33000, partial [Rhizobium johnstonii]